MKWSAIQAIVPLHPVVHHGNQKQEGFLYHKDAHVVMCPVGERSVRQKINREKMRKKVMLFLFILPSKHVGRTLFKKGV